MDNREAIAAELRYRETTPVMSGWLSLRARLMSDRKDLAWARLMGLLQPISPGHSTGPKSEDGKARVSRNAYKGGTRAILPELARLLREQVEALKRIG